MKIKTGDTVIVTSGQYKGKTGKVLDTMPKKNKVVVEGVNILTKHVKPRGPQQPGGIVKEEGPIDISNVMYYDEKSKKGTRVGYKIEDGKKVRIAKASGEEIK
ncbi:MAG: 50S ribosomal protein L24 [Gallicola sp.]|nr:50S ribosomal protein L24 [Gallicola sp.]